MYSKFKSAVHDQGDYSLTNSKLYVNSHVFNSWDSTEQQAHLAHIDLFQWMVPDSEGGVDQNNEVDNSFKASNEITSR